MPATDRSSPPSFEHEDLTRDLLKQDRVRRFVVHPCPSGVCRTDFRRPWFRGLLEGPLNLSEPTVGEFSCRIIPIHP